jgi:hypothetical protein
MVDYGSACENPPHVVRGGGRSAVQWGGILMLSTLLVGCSHLNFWPFRHKPTPPPPEVHELDESSEGGAAASYPQYWMRNTLIVDLQGVSGTGSVTLKPREHTTWPVRIALKVMPGSVGELEVRAAQRTVLPLTAAGAKPVVLELSPSIFTVKSPQIVVAWGPNPTPAE